MELIVSDIPPDLPPDETQDENLHDEDAEMDEFSRSGLNIWHKHGGGGEVLAFKKSHALSHSLSVRAKALVFEDPISRALEARITRLASREASLLLRGATGTGKELVARYIHAKSHRAKKAFVAVNCGAIAENLMESELFGHEKGAFTGAFTTKPGWFEAADGGTLFLDEIGDLPMSMQVKLLRVLQEREVVRVGSRRPIAIDIRLIAATNVHLEEAVAAERFREDLYYRLKVAEIHLPPLAERPGDIPALVDHFIRYYAHHLSRPVLTVAPAALEKLMSYPWPGNIRELENAVHHALIVCPDKARALNFEDFGLTAATVGLIQYGVEKCGIQGLEAALRDFYASCTGEGPSIDEQIERAIMTTAFEYSGRNQSATARLLGITRNVVRTRLQRFGLIAE